MALPPRARYNAQENLTSTLPAVPLETKHYSSGSVVINSSTTTLTGTNSYSGGTTFQPTASGNAMTLTGNTSSLQGSFDLNSTVSVTVRFNQTTDGTFAGNVFGSGNLAKLGAGTLTIAGPNSYSGQTTISAGQVAIGDNAALGTGPLSISGGSAISSYGGSRVITNPLTIVGSVAIAGANDLTISNTATFTLANGSTLTSSNLATTTLAASVIGAQGSLFVASGGNFVVGNPTSFSGFQTAGNLQVNSNATLTLRSAGFATIGGSTTIDGGTLAAPNGIVQGIGTAIVGHGAVDARIASGLGSTIQATGDLVLGKASAFDGYTSDGQLIVNNHVVTIQDRNQAVLGSITNIGNSDGPGTLAAPNGFLLAEGKNVVGYGTVTGVFENQGFVQGEGPSASDLLEFTSLVTGRGGFGGTVQFDGGYAPGNSPAQVGLENVLFAPSSTLNIDLAGPLQGGQYDYLNASGTVALAGALAVIRPANFTPALGDKFTIMTFASHFGGFADYTGTNLGAHMSLQPLFTTTSLALWAGPTQAGDVSLDGIVDIQDVTLIANHWLASSPTGDANGDGVVDIQDITLVANHWLQGGSQSAANITPVPEPSAFVLAACGCLSLVLARRRKVCL